MTRYIILSSDNINIYVKPNGTFPNEKIFNLVKLLLFAQVLMFFWQNIFRKMHITN